MQHVVDATASARVPRRLRARAAPLQKLDDEADATAIVTQQRAQLSDLTRPQLDSVSQRRLADAVQYERRQL